MDISRELAHIPGPWELFDRDAAPATDMDLFHLDIAVLQTVEEMPTYVSTDYHLVTRSGGVLVFYAERFNDQPAADSNVGFRMYATNDDSDRNLLVDLRFSGENTLVGELIDTRNLTQIELNCLDVLGRKSLEQDESGAIGHVLTKVRRLAEDPNARPDEVPSASAANYNVAQLVRSAVGRKPTSTCVSRTRQFELAPNPAISMDLTVNEILGTGDGLLQSTGYLPCIEAFLRDSRRRLALWYTHEQNGNFTSGLYREKPLALNTGSEEMGEPNLYLVREGELTMCAARLLRMAIENSAYLVSVN